MMQYVKKCSHPGLGLLLIRLALGIIFLVHGIAKLRGIDGTTMFFDAALPVGTSLAVVLAWVVALVETIGGAAMIFGIFTRVTGWLLAIIMVVAIVFVKSKMPFAAAELDIMLLASALGIAFAGPGMLALGRYIPCTKGACDHCGVCKGGCTGHEVDTH